MTPAADNTTRFARLRRRALALALTLLCLASLAAATTPTPPGFEKEFIPDTIGPGSTSMLVFTINNSDNPMYPVDMLAFDDELPTEIELAEPAFVSNSCAGIVTLDEDEADSGFDIRLTEGKVAAGGSCQIVVNVTSSTPGGPYLNTTGNLNSDAGTSDPAFASLTVDGALPSFTKSFMPAMVEFGGRSILTLTIDNPASGSDVADLAFEDVLPAGMVIADPANASTDCEDEIPPIVPPVLVADPGTAFISLFADGTFGSPLLAGDSCTVTVDVIGGAVGPLGNVTSELTTEFDETTVGKAAAVLTVGGFANLLSLEKRFIDDPAAPTGKVTLEFTVTNRSRDFSATAVTFSDDLDATLAGLAPSGALPAEPCGDGSSLGFAAGVLTLTGGSLAPEASCTFSVVLDVPFGAAPAAYPNTTSPVSGDIGGEPETGNKASDQLFVVSFPVLTKEFTDDPVAAGDSVTLEFTIFNPEDDSAMTAITFLDELTASTDGMGNPTGGFLPFPVAVTIPPGDPCGAGSTLTLVSAGTNRQGVRLVGGSLAVSDGVVGGADTCTFSLAVDIPVGFPSGTYLNTTGKISATVSAATTVGPAASDSIVIAGAPSLTKTFIDDPVLPSGGPVTLELTLTYDAEVPPPPLPAPPDATAIAFTDDLTTLMPAVPGLTATTVVSNTCAGSSVDITADPTKIDFSGGTLAPETDCTVTLTLTVPPGSPVGFHTNTTSDVTATVGGVMASNSPGEDDLLITPLVFTKEFLENPVIPGDTTTLRFTIANNGTSSTDDASGMAFSDTLSAILPGTPDVTNSGGAPTVNTCGGSESGTSTFLFYTGGSLTFGSTCTIEYELTVPAGAADGDYVNVTSSLSATIDGSGVTIPAATDVLSVDSVLLALSKEFTGDPVNPGETVTLEFNLTNLSAVETVTDIAFDDDLDAVLSGLVASGATTNTCGGMAAGFPAALFEYSGGSLAPGASCKIVLSVDVPDLPLASGPPYLNTTTAVAGLVDATLAVSGDPASDELLIQLVTFEKSYDGPTVAGGTAILTFMIANLDPVNARSELAFSDVLDALVSGLEAVPPLPSAPCGAGSVLAGTSFLTLSGGSLAAAGSPDDSCTFAVTVMVPAMAAAGDFLNSTSDLFQSGLSVAGPATDFLTIEPPPDFDKVFDPGTIFEDEISTLTFTIDNTASSLAASALDFTDTLPAGVVIATPPNASTDCSGGTLTAAAGTGTISYTGGSVADSAVCTVKVDVTSATADVYLNISGELTSSSGNSGTASDSLTVDPAEADLELDKIDVYEPAMSGRYQVYQLKVTNLGPATAQSVSLVDPLPADLSLVVATPTGLCVNPGGVLTCDLGDMSSGASVTVTVLAQIRHRAMPAALDNLASVSSDTPDPVPANNDVMESTEVIALAGVEAIADINFNTFPEVALPLEGSIDLLVKDIGTTATLYQVEVFPDGWALAGFEARRGVAVDDLAVMAVEEATGKTQVRVVSGATGALLTTAFVPGGHVPTAMTVISDDGLGDALIAVAVRRTADNLPKVFVFDADTGALTTTILYHPTLWPVDLAAVSSIAGDARVELGVLMVNTLTGTKRILLKELSGAPVGLQPLPTELIPLELQPLRHCCGMPADELATLGWNRTDDKVRVVTIDSSNGTTVGDKNYAGAAAPTALRDLPSFGATTADELAVLYRVSDFFAAMRVRDGSTGMQLTAGALKQFTGSTPLALAISPDSYDTPADELVIYWKNDANGVRRVSIRDPGSGLYVQSMIIP